MIMLAYSKTAWEISHICMYIYIHTNSINLNIKPALVEDLSSFKISGKRILQSPGEHSRLFDFSMCHWDFSKTFAKATP